MNWTRVVCCAAMTFVGFVLAGCGPNERPVSTASPAAPTASPAAEAAKAPTSSSPGMEQVITSWQNGDKAAAVSQFVQVDWSAQTSLPGRLALESQRRSVCLAFTERSHLEAWRTHTAGVTVEGPV